MNVSEEKNYFCLDFASKETFGIYVVFLLGVKVTYSVDSCILVFINSKHLTLLHKGSDYLSNILINVFELRLKHVVNHERKTMTGRND